MVYVIETNLSMKDDTIMDFQSRVIEVPSWEEYCAMHENYNGQACSIGRSVTQMTGHNINAHRIIENQLQMNWEQLVNYVWSFKEKGEK